LVIAGNQLQRKWEKHFGMKMVVLEMADKLPIITVIAKFLVVALLIGITEINPCHTSFTM
jgi:hypothetical protein